MNSFLYMSDLCISMYLCIFMCIYLYYEHPSVYSYIISPPLYMFVLITFIFYIAQRTWCRKESWFFWVFFFFVTLKLENLKLGELYINQTYGEHQDFAKQFWSIVSRGLGERYLSSMFAYLDGTFFCLSFRTQTIQIYFILEEIQMKKKVQALFLIWWLTPNIHKEYTWVEKGFLPRTLQGKCQLGREQGQQLQ